MGKGTFIFILTMGNQTSQRSVNKEIEPSQRNIPYQFKKISTLDDPTLLEYLHKESKIKEWYVIYLYTKKCLIFYVVI